MKDLKGETGTVVSASLVVGTAHVEVAISVNGENYIMKRHIGRIKDWIREYERGQKAFRW